MIVSVANIKRTFNYCKKNGFKQTFYNAAERLLYNKKHKYIYQAPTEEELEAQRQQTLSYRPLLSIIVPAYETEPVYMEDLVLSVMEQTYDHFELIIADASESNVVQTMVKGLMEQYDKIVYKRLDHNGGISVNSNAALELATGDYIGLLDHDDVLTPDALFHVAKAIADTRKSVGAPVLVYTDEDKTNSYMEYYYEPNIKCRFNYSMILTNNYVCHLSFYMADVIKSLGFRPEYDGAQDYDLVLRTLLYARDKYGKDYKGRMIHVPKVLYHWRCHEASTAQNPESKRYAYDSGLRAIESFLEASHIKAKVSHLRHLGFYRVDYTDGPIGAREDIGALAGPVCSGNQIIGGAMDGKGRPIYGGLNVHFSGYLHRAVLQQDVDVADIRNMIISDKLIKTFKKATGYDYPLDKSLLKDTYTEEENSLFVKKSLQFCNKLKEQGIGIMYEPKLGNEYYNSDAEKETKVEDEA